MLQRKNAALGAAFYFSLLPPPLRGRVGVGGNASTVVVATPTPNPRKGEGSKERASNQLAAAAGMSRWRFMTILLSAPR